MHRLRVRVMSAAAVVSALLLAHAPCQPSPFFLPGALYRQAPALPPDEASTLQAVPEDLNADGTVDAADLAIFAADWKAFKVGGALKARADFNADGKIDATDSARILQFVAYCQEHGSYTRPVGRAGIGPAGGVLDGPGFELTVPKGAFATDRALTLRRLPQLPDAGPGCASDTFELTGLPQRIGKPLELRMALRPGCSPTGFSFVAQSEDVFASSAGKLRAASQPVAATVEGNYVVTQIPATESAAYTEEPAQDEPRSLRYSVFSGYRYVDSTGGHFRIIFHPLSCEETRAVRIGVAAETAWILISTQYGLSWARRTRWPVEINVLSLPQDEGTGNIAECTGSKWGVNYNFISVDSGHCGSDEAVRLIGPVVEHEVFHLAQSLYDPRSAWAAATGPSGWYWLEEATAVEFEWERNVELVPAGAPIPIPDVLDEQGNFNFATLHSLEYPPGDVTLVRRHGYGAAMYVRSLIPFIGRGGLGQLFVAHRNDRTLTPCRALADAQGGSANWDYYFTGFAERWLAGTLAGPGHRFPSVREILSTRHDALKIGSTSIGERVTRNLPDLSMWPILINRVGSAPDGTEVAVLVEGLDPTDWRAVAQQYRGKDLVYQGTWGGVGGPAAIYNFEDGQGALFTVLNVSARSPYTRSAPVTVGIQLRPRILSVKPASGPPGTRIALQGYAFGLEKGQSTVSFQYAYPQPLSWSNSLIEFSAPDQPPYNENKSISVTVPGPAGNLAAGATFRLTAPPTP